MEEILKLLLEELELIGKRHEELYDSEVTQAVGNAIMDGFIRNKPGFVVPTEFGMYSTSANEQVRRAVSNFVTAANSKAAELGTLPFRDRMAIVQNRGVRTTNRRDYEDFFGHSPPEFYDEAGNVLRTQ
jgi:hypothetical protein